MQRPGRRASVFVLLALSGALLAGATQAQAVGQTSKNGCTSPQVYTGAVTSPAFNTGSGAASVSFDYWFEIESIAPEAPADVNEPIDLGGFDQMNVEYSLNPASPGDPRSWIRFASLNPASPEPGSADIGYSNNGLAATPTFTLTPSTFTLPPGASTQTGVQVRIAFNTRDTTYQGFRGLGIDQIAVNTGGGSNVQPEGFEAAPGWTFDPANAAGAPRWQQVSNSQPLAVKSPQIAPDLVTLPSGDSGALPDTANGTQYAWFGDAATGTFCGPDYANRFQFTFPPPPATTTQAPPKTLKDLPAPVLGKQANVQPVSGTVLVGIRTGAAAASRGVRSSQKGITFVPLQEARQVPVGSFLDTRKGTVALQSSSGSKKKAYLGNFASGLFQVLQSRKKSAKGLTDLVMKGGKFSSCKAKKKKGKRAAAALSKKALRRLRASGKGRFRTKGRYGAATVRGTKWTVTDRCDGTLVKVTRGKVSVRDYRRKKTVLVKTGKSYLAKAPR